MILVIGRPALDERGDLAGSAARVALAAARAGGRVELVGSIGDDPDGDSVAIALGRSGVGHAALLRDPGAATPRGEPGATTPPGDAGEGAPAPRLDARDIELGLHYLSECRVLVVAEPLEPDGLDVAQQTARYHGAALVVLLAPGAPAPAGLPADATVLSPPEDDSSAFADLVGRYAAALSAGRQAADAWHDAVAASGWQEAPGE